MLAGDLRRQQKELDEDIILIEAIKLSYYPKLIEVDRTIFDNLIADIFNSDNNSIKKDEMAYEISQNRLKERNYSPNPILTSKIYQLN